MSEELKTSEELRTEAETSAAETPETTETASPEEPAETMAGTITLKNWKLLSNRSMKAISSPEP